MTSLLCSLLLAVLTLHPLWSYHARRWITSTPTLNGGLVYIGTWSGDVVALDATTGAMRWVAKLGANPDEFYGQPRGVTSSIAVSNDVAYAVSGSCRAGAFDARSGATRWRRSICSIARNDDTYATPVVANGLVLFGIDILGDRPTDRGSLLALDARTGATRWQLFPQRYIGTGTGISATPVIDPAQGIGYIGTGNPTPISAPPPGPDPYSESILAFNLRSGAIVWAYGPVHPHDLHDNDLFASPNRFALGRHEIIGEGGKDGIYYAVDARNGKLLWRTVVDPSDPYASIIGTPAYNAGRIFVPIYGGAHGSLVALDARDGRILWRATTAGIYESPALWHGIVFAIDTNKTLAAFDAASGARILMMQLSGRSYGRGPRVDGSTLYLTAGSTLTAYAIR
jgi:outer membrane protein assembly factor BamB